MVALLEMSGTSALRVHVLMGTLLVSRLLHPLGMYAKPNTLPFWIGRAGGIAITLGLLIASALMILDPVRVWRRKLKCRRNQLKQQSFSLRLLLF